MQREHVPDQADAPRDRNIFNHVRRALFIYRCEPRIWLQVRVESCFSPFNAFHTVNSENHSSLCVTLRLPVFPEVFHYPQANLRLHPSRCFPTYIRRMRISEQTFDYRHENTLGLCADKGWWLKIVRVFLLFFFVCLSLSAPRRMKPISQFCGVLRVIMLP